MTNFYNGIIIMQKKNKACTKLLYVLRRCFMTYEAIPMKEAILELFVHIIHELAWVTFKYLCMILYHVKVFFFIWNFTMNSFESYKPQIVFNLILSQITQRNTISCKLVNDRFDWICSSLIKRILIHFSLFYMLICK